MYLLASQVVLLRCWNNKSLLPQSDHIKSQTGDLWKPCGSEWLSHGNWWTGCWQSLKPLHLFSLFGHSLQSIGVENDYAPSRHQDIKWYPKQVRTSLLAKLHPAKFRKREDTTSSLLVKDWSLTKTESVIQFRGFWNILNYQNSKIVWNSFPCKLAVWNLQFLLLNFGAAHQISKKRCTQGTFAPLLERPPWSRHCHPPPSCHPPR